MPPKRETGINVKVSEFEKEQIRKACTLLGENESDIVRACIALALPIIQNVEYASRVRLEDNIFFKEMSVK